MKVFLSWSGDRSQIMANALREWLPLVLHFTEPWLSNHDINAGERWSAEVAKELEESNFGIICTTKDNVNAPWVLFEAGALAKSMEDGRVTPLLLDLDFKEISGPLTQFQAKKVDEKGLKELATSINKAHGSSIPDEQLNRLFGALWSDLRDKIEEIPKISTPAKQSRPQGEILEELVSSIRSVEMRVREAVDEDMFSTKRNRRRHHPGMMHELIRNISKDSNDPMRIVVFGSIMKDTAPWIYELAMEVYRATTRDSGSDLSSAWHKLMRAVEGLIRTPLSEELGVDRRFLEMFLFEFEQPRLNEVGEAERRPRPRRPRKSPDVG